jgi:hypothetical protein
VAVTAILSAHTLTPAQLRAVEIARERGIVCAGANVIGHGLLVRVSNTTLTALVRRGWLIYAYGPDSQMAGKLTLSAREALDRKTEEADGE